MAKRLLRGGPDRSGAAGKRLQHKLPRSAPKRSKRKRTSSFIRVRSPPVLPNSPSTRKSSCRRMPISPVAKVALSEVLTRGGADASIPWENPESGARGTITPLANSYRMEGAVVPGLPGELRERRLGILDAGRGLSGPSGQMGSPSPEAVAKDVKLGVAKTGLQSQISVAIIGRLTSRARPGLCF